MARTSSKRGRPSSTKPASVRSHSSPRKAGVEGDCYLRSGMEWMQETGYQPSPAPSPDSRAAEVSSLYI